MNVSLERVARKSKSSSCFKVEASPITFAVYRFEGEYSIDDLRQGPGVAVGYAASEDPGPCKVALAFIYRKEDEGPLGPPRISNPGLHVKAISLGARQARDVAGLGRFDVVYVIVEDGGGDCPPLKCRGEDLHQVSSKRIEALK